ncbi:GldM family protein [Taibaiella chishuiensis]|uniref:GldM-like protein n=1 Tax=Taibaiella chishuiensis TaxID=1434707 RepID=A0A2P8D0X1_9BACT|nr:GldM family protein [Taibaiella chishuiensis]PSK90871.1 GldM-like protein [Taibaiella chishuiensis]
MKATILILISIIFFSYSFAQKEQDNFLVSNPRQKTLYIGIENPLQILTKQYSCNAIKIKVDNGKVRQFKESCSFTVNPNKPGPCKIEVFKAANHKLVGSIEFQSMKLPKPEIQVAGMSSGGTIAKGFMHAQRALQAKLDGFDIDVNYEILSFCIIIIRGRNVVFNHANVGSRFSGETMQAISAIEEKDQIIFCSIKYRDLDGELGTLSPAEYIITD